MNELPHGWIETAFHEVFDFKGGSQPPKSSFSSGSGEGLVRLLQIRDFEADDKAVYIKDSKKWPKCDQEDIMVGRYGASVGKVLSGKSGAYNVALVKWLFEPAQVKRSWVWYLLKSEVFQAPLSQLSRSAQNGFNKGDVSSFKLPLPPFNEQGRIAKKLDNLTARTKVARDELAHIPLLIEHYKKAILEKAFTGVLTADWRSRTKLRGLPPSENGLPEGWSVKQLQHIAHIQGGLALGKKRSSDEELFEVPYLRVANVQRGYLDLSEIKTLWATRAEIQRLSLMRGDILMNEGGDRDKLGRGWVWNGELAPCIHQNHVFRVRLLDSNIPPRYISYFANEFGQKYFFDEGKQTTNLASVSKSKVSALPVPIPPPAEALEIVRLIEEAMIWMNIVAIEQGQAAHLLDHLDQALLARAFRGELVPQDPNDEPAEKLLEHIRAARSAEPKSRRGRRSRAAA